MSDIVIASAARTPIGAFNGALSTLSAASLGTVAIEFFSFAVAWKPSLHRPWGMGLIAMHLVIGLAMEIIITGVQE